MQRMSVRFCPARFCYSLYQGGIINFYMRENSFRHFDKKRSLKNCYSFIFTMAFLKQKSMMLTESLYAV